MKGIVTYGSVYGSSKAYAERLASDLNFEIVEYSKVLSFDCYDWVVHFGGLYAGKVKGLKEVSKNIQGNNFVIATVGLGDPSIEKTISEVDKCIKNSISEDVLSRAKVFYLRGSMDFSKLNFTHKMMMNFMYAHLNKMNEEEKTQEVYEILKTKDEPVNFVDFNSLKEIEDYILQI